MHDRTSSHATTTSPTTTRASRHAPHANGMRFPRARARARTRAGVGVRLAALLVLVATALLVATATTAWRGTGSTGTALAATTPASTIPALDARWFALGANVPWVRWRCDFGCGRTSGVRATSDSVDLMLRTMSRRGVRVARWYLFPDDAWQVSRGADDMPTGVSSAALHDLDEAVRLAAKHDVFLLPVVLPQPGKVPITWFSDPAQAGALATALRPMFARYRGNEHILGWELGTAAEQLVDAGLATTEQVRAHAAAQLAALRAAAPQRLAIIGMTDVSRIDTWVGLGADAYLAQDPTGLAPDRAASATTTAALATSEGLDAPIIVGGFQASTTTAATTALQEYARRGYAGALGWSWRSLPHPATPDTTSPMMSEATWRFHYDRPGSGPRSLALNPCYGPDAASYRCPNLRMSSPSDFVLEWMGRRTVLLSTNSINNFGTGPASLRGTRDGRYTMAAKQLLHRSNGGKPQAIPTGAKLLFKAIPGQYRYWKWNGAARMELWRLDSTGEPVERTVVGPKTVYCLRDLKRQFPRQPFSPRAMQYPACSQVLSRQSVTLGTSVGWSDVYPYTYHENWIDVTGLRGCFAYVHIADPTNVIYESNEDDNTSRTVVKLPFTGSSRGCPGARPLPISGSNGTY